MKCGYVKPDRPNFPTILNCIGNWSTTRYPRVACRSAPIPRSRHCHPYPRRRDQGTSRDRPSGRSHLHHHDQGSRPLRPGGSIYTGEDECKLILVSQISQAFAGLDTNRSVGVFGDQRVWGYIVILRAVRTKDFMSAEVFNFDNVFLAVSLIRVLVILLTTGPTLVPDPKSRILFFAIFTDLSTLECLAYYLQSGRWSVACCLRSVSRNPAPASLEPSANIFIVGPRSPLALLS